MHRASSAAAGSAGCKRARRLDPRRDAARPAAGVHTAVRAAAGGNVWADELRHIDGVAEGSGDSRAHRLELARDDRQARPQHVACPQCGAAQASEQRRSRSGGQRASEQR
eukprot:6870331-Prymnesium_polylepis.1